MARRNLGGDENRLARQARAGDGLPDLGLVFIVLCGVQVAVSGFKRGEHGVHAFGPSAAISAEAEPGDRV